jgi:hypothetical protein
MHSLMGPMGVDTKKCHVVFFVILGLGGKLGYTEIGCVGCNWLSF